MIEIRLATLVVIWFPKYLLTNKYMLDLKILHALGIATNMIIRRKKSLLKMSKFLLIKNCGH